MSIIDHLREIQSDISLSVITADK